VTRVVSDKIRAKTLPPGIYGPEQGMRPDSQVKRWRMNFVFNDGGMGDFVNYSASTVWVAKNCPWVDGWLFCPRYLIPIMEEIHAGLPMKIVPMEEFSKLMESGTAYMGPSIHINGVNTTPQLLTCMGAHQFDVGFAFYSGSCTPPNAELPVLDFPRERLNPKVRRLDGYAVVTTGNGFATRSVYGKHINPIIEYLKEKKLTPVFLGKSDLLGDGKTVTRFADDIAYDAGVDLRNQTTVKDAACILQHAALTIGLDNGLLHLAALMKDSRIVFGYNITSIEHRAPRRSHGKTVNVALSEKDLICVGCQSKWKIIAHHNFDKCFYGDYACIEKLFEKGSARWKAAIDEVLK
jgi:hypothetical protein